jgi:hypothetical protein
MACYKNKNDMLFWPFKQVRIESSLKKDELMRILNESTDQDQKSIYWGKRFYKRFWGKVSGDAFRIRPVVPYWNMSPVEMKGSVKDIKEDKNGLDITLQCPYLRVVMPLAVIALGLFFVNYGLKGQWDVFLSSSFIILVAAYLFVNIPFQIQSIWSLKTLTEKLGGKLQKLK